MKQQSEIHTQVFFLLKGVEKNTEMPANSTPEMLK
jgi:hypothetical protein